MSHARRFTAEKIGKRIDMIRKYVRVDRRPFAPFSMQTLPDAAADPDPSAPATEVPWNTYWAGQNTHFVLRTTFTVPEAWQNPALHLPMGVAGDIFTHPESLVHIDGQAIGSADRYHHTIPLDRALADGKPHDLMLQGWTGLAGWPPDPSDPAQLFMNECAVVEIDRVLESFITLAEVALDVAQQLAEGRPEKHRLLNALDRAFLTLDTRDLGHDDFRASMKDALRSVRIGISEAGVPMDITLHGIGHAHMDVAYLWPISQIRRKNARTYSNVLRLMDQFPEYRFSHSQPQLYEWTEEDYPEMFEEIRTRVKEGRWEVLGGMWVEPDTNMPGAEALVRQILLSRQYALKVFGQAETPVLWLPDTFGFAASLPQLMKQAGLKWFVTNKLNWNQTNQIPSSSTWWEGIDGSRVLAQFLTTPREVQHLPFPTNYKSDLSAYEVIGTWERNTAKAHVEDLMIAYGYGDGGGGPTEELIRKARVYSAMPGAPRLRPSSVREFFEAIDEKKDRLPVWQGELYLEGHRGVLTSQAWIKHANRTAECLLHDAEFLLALAGLSGQDLRPAWKMLCTNQFHDILTGTSITEVFDDARKDFAQITWDATAAMDRAIATLEPQLTEGADVVLVDASPLPAPRLVLIDQVPDGYLDMDTGEALPVQTVEDGTLVELPERVVGYSVSCLRAVLLPGPDPLDAVTATPGPDYVVLENGMLCVQVQADGTLASVYDKRSNREVIEKGARGNILQAFEDRPISWDAWDIDPFFEDRGEVIGGVTRFEITESGPLRACIVIERQWRSSTICQRISLTRRSRRIDFKTEIDWHDHHFLVKAAFPVAMRATRATYNIQWGHIDRPTHRNTSWDAARFEVCAQKWAHLGEADYGVALLNDGKYGHDVKDNVMRLSLLRSPTSPDPVSDQGKHSFVYALMPHPGDWRDHVPAEAYALNHPVRRFAVSKAQGQGIEPLVTFANANVMLETVKPSEDGNGTILRLYEAHRMRGPVKLRFREDITWVGVSSLLEDRFDPVEMDDHCITIDLAPFEIVTLRIGS
ncbi:alpha-mannosidase [Shimia ponticola]|uniref:alpha-mannosidase n=1 Tax=Shimia ponticola TaxID=2582893 RepID=UPI0011BF8B26|nr:glycoside hydrolase family 38 C-terminal domain-containing protein [Shimia ponticola]